MFVLKINNLKHIKVLFCLMHFIGLTSLYSQPIEINYNDCPIQCSFQTDSGKIIIQNIHDFKKITNCSTLNYNLYEEYTLIGLEGSEGGCEMPKVDFHIYQDIAKKEYIIDASIYIKGNCRLNNIYSRVIYVNKLRTDYKITFNTYKYFE